MEESDIAENILDRPDERNACNNESMENAESYCHFHWATKTLNGGYVYLSTSEKNIKIEFIESTYDKILYSYLLNPRF